MPYIIDPLAIATDGIKSSLNSVSAITVATNGFIVFVTEEIIEPVPEIIAGGTSGIGGTRRKRKKRITATVQHNGTDYVEVVETENVSIELSDVSVTVLMEDNRPKITIILD